MPPVYAAMLYRSYAKINLFLDVLDRRPDGYTNIETIFQTVSLCDELLVRENSRDIRLSCSNPDLDAGENNLVYKAAVLLKERSQCPLGANIHLEKRIPIAAGLAGGSGDAAAALVALHAFWGLNWPETRLRALALELGSDVPYCTIGGTAAATGRGEMIAPLPEQAQSWMVLAHPPLAVSAGYVYHHPKLARSPESPQNGRTPAFQNAIEALAKGDFPKVVFNRMEVPVFYDHPELERARDLLLELGCIAAAMSGSGPTLFGVCDTKEDADRVAESFRLYPVSVVCTVPCGVEQIA